MSKVQEVEKIYTVDQVADMLKLDRQVLVMWERRGHIPSPNRKNRPMTYTDEQVRWIRVFSKLAGAGLNREDAASVADEIKHEEGIFLVQPKDLYILKIDTKETDLTNLPFDFAVFVDLRGI